MNTHPHSPLCVNEVRTRGILEKSFCDKKIKNKITERKRKMTNLAERKISDDKGSKKMLRKKNETHLNIFFIGWHLGEGEVLHGATQHLDSATQGQGITLKI